MSMQLLTIEQAEKMATARATEVGFAVAITESKATGALYVVPDDWTQDPEFVELARIRAVCYPGGQIS